MRVKLVTLVVMALGVTPFLTACDWFAEYTVVNETDEELLTWAFRDDCGAVPRDKYDYFQEEVVKPHERHEYSQGYWGRDPECVYVVAKDRRPVLAEPYEYRGTYMVREPLRPLGDPLPERDDLPNPSWTDLRDLSAAPPILFVVLFVALLLGLAVLGAFLFAVFITVRFFYRYYVSKT